MPTSTLDLSPSSSTAPPLVRTPRLGRLPSSLWWKLLLVGAPVWLVAASITEVTGDDILLPTVLVVGSFLIPLTLVAFALSRRTAGHLTIDALAGGFVVAGTLGVVATALIETYVVPAAAGTFIAVALIEETAKGLLVYAFARGLRHDDVRDGMVLGAVIGAGFAAFESTGYAVQTLLDHAGSSQAVLDIMETEATRAMLAPFGHILWTALLGGALFASTRNGRFTLTWRLVLTFVGVVALHSLWDESEGWAIMVAKGVTGAGWDLVWPNAQAWVEAPDKDARLWFNIASDALLALLAIAGTVWITVTWRRTRQPRPGIDARTLRP
jgi:protease PrsW